MVVMTQKKFSKDPKVHLISIEQFFEQSNYLTDINEDNLWNANEFLLGTYYKVTSRFLIQIDYVWTAVNFGMDDASKIEKIQVAFRDGKTEYDLLDLKLKQILQEKKKSSTITKEIKNIQASRDLLDKTKYTEYVLKEQKDFTDFIVDVDYKTSIDSFVGKYVVFDVETNGVRISNDDLLSISIYDLTIGKCYNRFLPLDLQPMVLTSWIHGITDEDLEGLQHITQEEINELIDFFDLNNKILLSYSGGKGTFDSSVIINYCKRHNLVGFENLHYENIKSRLPHIGYGFEGLMSKDNICKLFKIDGIKKKHSGINDCILEWRLFEKIENQPLFFIDKNLFKYNKGYIVPVSYLNKHPELIKYADISIPHIEGIPTVVFEYAILPEVLRQVKKFPTNITGIALENAINAILKAEKQDNIPFLVKNKNFLEYIGSLDSRIMSIPIEVQKDGTLESLDSKYDDYIKEINKESKILTDSLSSVFDFIKQYIFKSGKILSQELVVSNDGKILSLCDLSNEECVLEIKTFKISSDNKLINTPLVRQLYYESKDRKTFVLSIDFEQHTNDDLEKIIDAINIRIYHIELKETEPKPIEKVRILYDDEIAVLNLIQDDSAISNAQIVRQLKLTQNRVGNITQCLIKLKYIVKEDALNKRSRWIILRSSEDNKTKYLEFNGRVNFIFDNK